MKYKSCISMAVSRALAVVSVVTLGACAGMPSDNNVSRAQIATPTVDYIESLDVYTAPHQDSFLNQLAMNYRSYAIYNARTSGYPEVGELFAQKAVAAFSGELPFPETLEGWVIEDDQTSFELYNAYTSLMDQLKNDASDTNPELAAEAQAKFDCWISAVASGQTATAAECRARFDRALTALRDCKGGKVVAKTAQVQPPMASSTQKKSKTMAVNSGTKRSTPAYYPETRDMDAMTGASRARDGIIIVNNVNIPENLITTVPVPVQVPTQSAQPIVFNQNIYGGDKTVSNSGNAIGNTDYGADCVNDEYDDTEQIPEIGDELVTREEFINMMMAMRSELTAINARLDKIQAAAGEKTMIKVQQIPLEPKQHVMEEIFEIRFDFNQATIKPEYEDLIRKLATATQNNKNIKVSVVGHTDTMGSKNYNYALGGRRADAVQKMLIKYGIPASQIVAVSAGEEGLKVPTPDGVANAENRRVRVVKEVHYTEPARTAPVAAIAVEEYSTADCGMYGCQD